ncbi:MAG: ParA family protein [Lentisphaerae bacterium]|nr:ParA family protein [Lentisphaerota bacterium]
MTKIITVCTPKGGVGKTTLAYYYTRYCSTKGKTLAIDTDSQGNLTRFLVGDENSELDEKHSFVALFSKKKAEPIKVSDTISLLGSDIRLSKYDAKNELDYFFLLTKFLKNYKNNYDYVVIDTPPNLGMFTFNALLTTEFVLAPFDPSVDALRGIEVLFEAIKKIKADYNDKIKMAGLVINSCDFRNSNDKNIYNDAKAKYPEYLLESVIPRTTKIRDARVRFESVVNLLPKHKVSLAFKSLFEEVDKVVEKDNSI